MLPGQTAILAALDAALTARGYGGVAAQLQAIEPPRDWGATTNVSFMLAGRAAQAEIEQATAGLEKKGAKALAAEITRAAGPKLAAELAADLSQIAGVARVEAEGAYINFYYDPVALSGEIVGEVLRGDYGAGAPTGKRIMVEYAQPNTHKEFHVGHLRNASIGQAIANVLEFEGNEVLKATYIGDVGAHVAKTMWWHLRHPELRQAAADPLAYWGECYQAGNVAGGVDEVKEEQREWLRQWEQGDAGARSAWQTSRDECVQAFREIFAELSADFSLDCWFFESNVDDTQLGQKTAAELKERGIAVVDESDEYKGALYVDFALHADNPIFKDGEFSPKKLKQLGKMTILRSDSTSLYQTKELGLAKYKFDNFAIDESLYVVGSEQRLYFEQVFAILRLWGFPNASNCRHIAYELVVLPEGKMSSREGTVVSYRELRDEAVRRATEITREKMTTGEGAGPTDEVLDKTAKDIAIAAIKYAMLQVSGNQQIVFDFEQALSFDGRAAPYLQYAYARAGKLVGDAVEAAASRPAEDGGKLPPPPGELHASEIALTRTISLWPQTARTAAAKYEPAVIANYLYELADAFNAFYRDCRVLDAPDAVKPWRQQLTAAFRAVLRTGFKLLALPLPEAM